MRHLRNTFALPHFDDEDKNLTARLLLAIGLIIVAVTLLLTFPLALILPRGGDVIALQGIASLVFCTGLYFLIRRGAVRWASVLLVGLFWLLNLGAVVTGGGIRASAFTNFVLLIFTAGLLLGARAGAMMTALCALAGLGLVLAETNGILPPSNVSETPVTLWFSYTAIFAVVAVLQGLSARMTRQALHRARASEERYRLISSVISDYTFSTSIDAQGQPEYDWIAGAFESITGYTIAEFRALGGWSAMVHPDDAAQDERDRAKLYANQRAVSDVRILRKSGEVRWVRTYAHPAWDAEHNRLAGIFGAVQDITERKQAEAVLSEQAAEMAMLYRASTRLASSAIHDLRGLAQQVTDIVVEELGCHHCRLWLIREDGAALQGLAYSGAGRDNVPDILLSGPGLTVVAVQSAEPVYVPDVRQDPRYLPGFAATRSEFVVPLMARAGLIGVLNLEHPAVDAFSERTRRMLLTFAERAALIIENAQLYQAAQAELIERTRIQDALRASEEKFAKAFHSSPDAITISTLHDGRFVEVNEGFERMFGIRHDDAIGKTSLELETWRNPSDREQLLTTLQAEGQVRGLEVEYNAAGGVLTCLVSAEVIELNGETCLVAFTRDITKRKRAEAALQKSEERYRGAISAAGLVPYVIDYQTKRFTFIGEGILKLTGYTAEEFTPMMMKASVQEDYIWGSNAHLTPNEARQRFLAGELSEWHSDMRILTRTGESRWLSDASIQLLDEHGKMSSAIGILQDITERKQAEQDLKHHADEMHLLYEMGMALTSGQDLYHALRALVKELQRLMVVDTFYVSRYDEQTDLLSFPLYLALGDDTHIAARRLSENPGLSGEVISNRTTLYLPDIADPDTQTAHQIVISVNLDIHAYIGIPLLIRERIIGLMSVQARQPNAYTPQQIRLLETLAAQVAITLEKAGLFEQLQQELAERRRAETEVRTLNAELEQRVADRTAELAATNRDLESFSYSVSHDLRAPLRAMDGFSRLLLEDYQAQLTEDGQHYLRRIRTGAQRMGALIDDLLAFSRLGRQTPKKQWLSEAEVRRLVNQTLDELRTEADDRRVVISIGELPACSADPALLKQVLANLLGNALKYSRARAEARLEIGSHAQSGATVYFVRDNGVGFDMRFADQLFGVFQRLHRADEFEGTGVGLAIVQRIIERHGGRIWAEAEVDKGATFYFTLPQNH